MHLLKLLREFVKVVLCISRHLPNKKKLKFDQAFNASLKMLNESMYSICHGSDVPLVMFRIPYVHVFR